MDFEILPFFTFTHEEIWPIVTRIRIQREIYRRKTRIRCSDYFKIRLVRLKEWYRAAFFEDFSDEDIHRYLGYLSQGYSFGAYQQSRLVAFAISETIPWSRSLRIWEFQVMQGFRRQGIGRALMNTRGQQSCAR